MAYLTNFRDNTFVVLPTIRDSIVLQVAPFGSSAVRFDADRFQLDFNSAPAF